MMRQFGQTCVSKANGRAEASDRLDARRRRPVNGDPTRAVQLLGDYE